MKCPCNTSMLWDMTERKLDNIIFECLPLYRWKIKGIMILEPETITVELLLIKLTHQPLLSLAVWNLMELNIQKSSTWLLIFLAWLHSLREHESELIFDFLLFPSGYGLFGRLLFCVQRTQKRWQWHILVV